MRHMNRWMMTALFAGMFALTAQVASAQSGQPGEEYRSTMTQFVPQIQAWQAESQDMIEVATVKPELGCTAEVAELARRGRSISQDLRGTADLAPEGLAKAHLDLTMTVERMSIAISSTCEDSAVAANRMARVNDRYNEALGKIMNFITLRHATWSDLPDRPASGN